MGQQWKFYYLYGLERAGRLSGVRFFGQHDWYREGAEELVHEQDKFLGYWRGTLYEREPLIATSFALLFLAKGRAPVLINKLRHGPVVSGHRLEQRRRRHPQPRRAWSRATGTTC